MPAPTVPLDSDEFWNDPYPTLNRLRDDHRTAVTPDGSPVMLRWDDAEHMKKSPDFVNEGLEFIEARGFAPGDPLYEWRRHSLGAQNGAAHQRLRALVNRAMTVNSVQRVRPSTRRHASALLRDSCGPNGIGEIEVTAAVRRIPFMIITEFLGIDIGQAIEIGQRMGGGGDAFGPAVTQEIRDRANETFASLMEFVNDLVDQRRAEPRDDLLTRLIAAEAEGDRLTEAELIVLFTNIFGGAVESTGSVMTSTFLELARHPDQLALLAEDPEERKRGVIEEVLRHRPAFVEAGQKAARPASCGGLDFDTGDRASIIIGAANRDPSRWPDPDRFDISRDPKVWSFTFSMGAHFCLGQALARTELQELAAAIAVHCEDLEILNEPTWMPHVTVNRLDALRVRYRFRE